MELPALVEWINFRSGRSRCAYAARRRDWVCMMSTILCMMAWSVNHQEAEERNWFLETGRRFLADLAVKSA